MAAINPSLPLHIRAGMERKRGILFGILASFLFSLTIAAILVFGFQKGLPVTERCNCSWQKTIVFSVSSFVVYLLQTIGYLLYSKKCEYYVAIKNPSLTSDWECGGKTKYFVLNIALFSILSIAAEYLLIPFLTDQNGNFLWFFQSGMGIVCVAATFVESLIISISQKILFTQQMY